MGSVTETMEVQEKFKEFIELEDEWSKENGKWGLLNLLNNVYGVLIVYFFLTHLFLPSLASL